ncbi:unnamed protein product [Leptidea sinapis]|uniref:1-acylglycerol-3-phosphate O-acyltransferase n=1 Tax=Leptidea sinapis TaxID=189913 RepID=A0A5E4Q3E7_9NEOP|nr:unnamed protein product [Leptidea sinapis]
MLSVLHVWEIVKKMTLVAKKEVFYTGPIGIAGYLTGIVYIDRNDPKKAYKELCKTSQIMATHKTKIWIYPEGTRNGDYSKMLRFKNGAFAMAIAAQKPIIPVVFSPMYFINHEKMIFEEGHVILQCLEPIPTEGMTMDDVVNLKERVRNVMEKAYVELSKEVQSSKTKDIMFSPSYNIIK